MPRKMAVVMLLTLSSVFASAQTTEPQVKSILLKANRMLDVRTGKYVANAGVLVENDKIKEAGPLAEVQAHAPKGATIIDLGIATLLPGLIDCHAHLLTSGTSISSQEVILNAAAGMSPRHPGCCWAPTTHAKILKPDSPLCALLAIPVSMAMCHYVKQSI